MARPKAETGGGRADGTAPLDPARPPPPAPPRKGEGSGRGALGNDTPPGLILLGEFGRPHGLRGEVRLKSYTADPLAIATYGPLATGRGGAVTLGRVRQAAGDQPDLLVATVAGVATREAAEALNRVRVYVARDKLPAAEDEDEFLLADLIGLAVQDEDGAELGRVLAVPNYGGGDLLEIAPASGGPSYLLPFTKAVVPAVDVAAGRLTVRSPEVENERS